MRNPNATPGHRIHRLPPALLMTWGIAAMLLFVSACSPTTTEAPSTPSPTRLPPRAIPTPTDRPPAPTTSPATPTDTPFAPTTSPSAPTPAGPAIEHLAAGVPVVIGEIHMIDAQRGWALGGRNGEDEHVLRSDDSGETWRDVTPPETASTMPDAQKAALAFFLDADTAWVTYSRSIYSEEERLVWRTRDGGLSWWPSEPFSLPNYAYFAAVLHFSDADAGWLAFDSEPAAGTSFVSLYRTLDGGSHWEHLTYPDETEYLGEYDSMPLCYGGTFLAFGDRDSGWLLNNCGILGRPGVYRSEDGASTWQSVELPSPAEEPDLFERRRCEADRPFLFTPGTGGFALTCQDDHDAAWSAAFLYRTQDGGRRWRVRPYPGGTLYFLNPDVGSSLGRTIHRTDDGGQTWTRVKSVLWDGQFSFVSEKLGWAVARSGEEVALVRTRDGGQSWDELKPVIAPPKLTFTVLDMITATNGWAIGSLDSGEDRVLRTTDGGRTWKDVTPPIQTWTPGEGPWGEDYVIWIRSGLTFFLGTEHAWVSSSIATEYEGWMGAIWRTADGGRSWTLITTPEAYYDEYSFLQFLDAQRGWLMTGDYVGAGGSQVWLFRTDNGGASWTPVIDRGRYEEISDSMDFFDQQTGLMAHPGDGYYVTSAYVSWTSDGGASWTRMDMPPPTEERSLFDDGWCGTSRPRLSTARVAMVNVYCNDYYDRNTRNLWVYRTVDAGSSWVSYGPPLPPLPDPTSGVQQYRSATMDFLTQSQGWAKVTDTFVLGEESTSYLSYLYWTSDGGRTWSKMSTFPWTGAIEFVSAETGWAVAETAESITLVGTRDGGRTWQSLEAQLAP